MLRQLIGLRVLACVGWVDSVNASCAWPDLQLTCGVTHSR